MATAVAAGVFGATASRAAETPLRAVFLNGNPVQAFPDPATGALKGPAVDIAAEIARRLGRPLDFKGAPGVEGVLGAVREGRADLGFIAFDPTRGQGVTFSPPYLLSLNSYAVLASSPVTTQEQVDRVGVRVGVNLGDAGGLYLQRNLKAASVHPITTPEQGRDFVLASTVDVMAANRQRLSDLVGRDARFRILPGHYFAVPQTIAVRQDDAALAKSASNTVRELLQSGFVAASIARAGLVGAQAAPLESPPGA